ncbi:class I SAM-dependent methyltransferase [Thermus caldilimi]|uniref:class I SAM-dependent methyltransferase n=1 Tax=Thermus caldilimi TaxID=2483360 RepID=UPI001076482C|nr:class I SAM-dependent methyltransferase [Thermus caldilimi]
MKPLRGVAKRIGQGYNLLSNAQKAGLTPKEIAKLVRYMAEYFSDKTFLRDFHARIEEAKQAAKGSPIGGWFTPFGQALLYALVRLFKPSVAVETGVAAGGSSRIILYVMQKNEKGRLFSIDLPEGDMKLYPKDIVNSRIGTYLPPGYSTGWLVPEWLKGRWKLYMGDARLLLPELLESIGEVDLFLHDSLHTSEQVRMELEVVFPRLRRGGLLMADDVNEDWTLAFVDFIQEQGLRPAVFAQRYGVALKR